MPSHALKIKKLFQNNHIFILLYLRSIDDYSLLDTFDKYQLPIFYELIYEFEDFDHPPLTHESISRVVQSQQTDLEPLVRLEDSEKLALRINDLLKSLLKF